MNDDPTFDIDDFIATPFFCDCDEDASCIRLPVAGGLIATHEPDKSFDDFEDQLLRLVERETRR